MIMRTAILPLLWVLTVGLSSAEDAAPPAPPSGDPTPAAPAAAPAPSPALSSGAARSSRAEAPLTTASNSVQTAESVVWSPGDTIDLPCALSTENAQLMRTVQLPFPIDLVLQPWDEQAANPPVSVSVERNFLTVKLYDPSFTGNLTLVDVQGNSVLFQIRPVGDGDNPKPMLVVRTAAEVARKAENALTDTDGAIIHLMRAMALNDTEDPNLTSSKLYTFERGKRYRGQTLFANNTLRVVALKQWIGNTLMGLETVWEWKGEGSMRLPIQRISFPGHIATGCHEEAVIRRPTHKQPRPEMRTNTLTLYLVFKAASISNLTVSGN